MSLGIVYGDWFYFGMVHLLIQYKYLSLNLQIKTNDGWRPKFEVIV